MENFETSLTNLGVSVNRALATPAESVIGKMFRFVTVQECKAIAAHGEEVDKPVEVYDEQYGTDIVLSADEYCEINMYFHDAASLVRTASRILSETPSFRDSPEFVLEEISRASCVIRQVEKILSDARNRWENPGYEDEE